MQNTPAIFLAAILAAAISGTVVYLVGQDPAAPAPAASGASIEDVTALQEQVAALQDQLANQSAIVAPDREAAGPGNADLEAMIRAAVAQALAERGPDGAAVAADASAGGANLASIAAGFTPSDSDPGSSMWRDAIKGGYMDELIEEFKARAAATPSDADAQVALAASYIAKLTNDNVSQVEQQGLAMKAHAAWDEALAINPRHWEARFSMAVSYSHWPPYSPGPARAVKEFQTLIQQQEEGAPKPQHADSYAILANLLNQQGKNDEAKKVLEQGRLRHPNASSLSGN